MERWINKEKFLHFPKGTMFTKTYWEGKGNFLQNGKTMIAIDGRWNISEHFEILKPLGFLEAFNALMRVNQTLAKKLRHYAEVERVTLNSIPLDYSHFLQEGVPFIYVRGYSEEGELVEYTFSQEEWEESFESFCERFY